jgi:hypothetical protein
MTFRQLASGGEHGGESLLERGARQGADDSVDLLSVADDDEQRDRLCAESYGELRIGVDVDLYTLRCPACRLARSSSTGEIIRHGPHQAAQKSTTTGTEAVVSSANVVVSVSTTHGSADLHTGQRGVPCGMGPTRFRAPQVGQVTIAIR